MSKTVSFYVSGDPRPQPRARAFARKMGGKYVARVYNAGTAENWKSAIADAARKANVPAFGDCPLSIELFFSFRRPKSHFKKDGHVRDSAPKYPMSRGGGQKGDWENLGKAVCDALTVLGVWTDDAQIVRATVDKGWAIGSSQGGCFISIAEAEVTDMPDSNS